MNKLIQNSFSFYIIHISYRFFLLRANFNSPILHMLLIWKELIFSNINLKSLFLSIKHEQLV